MGSPSTLNLTQLIRQRYNTDIATKLDSVLATSAVGSIERAMGNAMLGYNHRSQYSPVAPNKDYYGLTFFTRPDFNLTTNNLRAHRIMNALNHTSAESIQRFIRATLDPSLVSRQPGLGATFVDNRQAFIPLLTNSLISISGWPDMAAYEYTSPQGMMKEEMSWVDGPVLQTGKYSITANFRNMRNNPVLQMFYYWLHYQALVYMGILVPYPINALSFRIDYNTRIYRLVMDETKRYVTAIACCGAAYPVSCPIGALFNYESDRPVNQNLDQFSINFTANVFYALDPIIVDMFNRTVIRFCPMMAPATRASHFKQIPYTELEFFNYAGFPYINDSTMELTWWTDIQEYNAAKRKV